MVVTFVTGDQCALEREPWRDICHGGVELGERAQHGQLVEVRATDSSAGAGASEVFGRPLRNERTRAAIAKRFGKTAGRSYP